MIAAASAPPSARKAISQPMPGASIAPRLVATPADEASAITRSLP
jgi:hypothetical protein